MNALFLSVLGVVGLVSGYLAVDGQAAALDEEGDAREDDLPRAVQLADAFVADDREDAEVICRGLGAPLHVVGAEPEGARLTAPLGSGSDRWACPPRDAPGVESVILVPGGLGDLSSGYVGVAVEEVAS